MLSLDFPYYFNLVLLTSAGCIISFVVWRKRNDIRLPKEHYFDFIFFYIILGIIILRIFSITQNWDDYKHLSWSISPYFYKPGAERIWFRQLPWTFFMFWKDKSDIILFLQFSLLTVVSFFGRKKIFKKNEALFLIAIITSQIFLSISITSILFIRSLLTGKDIFTSIPISLIIVLVFFVLWGLKRMINRSIKRNTYFDLYLILFSLTGFLFELVINKFHIIIDLKTIIFIIFFIWGVIILLVNNINVSVPELRGIERFRDKDSVSGNTKFHLGYNSFKNNKTVAKERNISFRIRNLFLKKKM